LSNEAIYHILLIWAHTRKITPINQSRQTNDASNTQRRQLYVYWLLLDFSISHWSFNDDNCTDD
jgi:hypothetical protein